MTSTCAASVGLRPGAVAAEAVALAAASRQKASRQKSGSLTAESFDGRLEGGVTAALYCTAAVAAERQ